MLQLRHFPGFLRTSLLLVSLIGLGGCKDNPGKWSQDKVTSKVSESLEVTELSLSPAAGGLEGTGKRADGETVTVTVTQDAAKGSIRWEAKGDRGFVETGWFSVQ